MVPHPVTRALALLAFLLCASSALAQGVGSPTTINCGASVNFTGLNATTILVTAGATKLINFCGWHVTNTAAAGTFAITMGTGAACGSNTLNVTPGLNVTSSAPSADHQQAAFISSPLQGQSLCITPSVITISGVLYYGIN